MKRIERTTMGLVALAIVIICAVVLLLDDEQPMQVQVVEQDVAWYAGVTYPDYCDEIVGTFSITYTVLTDRVVEYAFTETPITITEHISPNILPAQEMPSLRAVGDVYADGVFSYLCDGEQYTTQKVMGYRDLETPIERQPHGYYILTRDVYHIFMPLMFK
jgi:hypothetical protein